LARIDDYTAAFELAAEKLESLDPALVAEKSGARLGAKGLRLDFVGQRIRVGLNPVVISGPEGAEVGLTDQVLILHYLNQADGRPVTGEWIAYREIPGAQAYHPVFYKRATAPLVAGFGQRPELLLELSGDLSAKPGQGGDAAVIIQALPRVPLMLQVWKADEDFEAEAGVLLDRSISGYLSAEDVAWLAGRVVYPLVGRAKGAKA
jgi:hypothetical protein